MSLLRFKMVDAAINHTAVEVKAPEGRPSDYFGEKVFGREAMRKYLDKKTYAALLDTMEHRTPLTREIADSIAAGMRQWALEHGADHYTHWFQPLTGGTAEKHDAFAEPDGCGGVLEEFSGKLLVQQESDASSFPNGGIRNTFEARGYSAWDPASPAFIVDTTLCIPTVFISYTGEALDYKVPLLRSLTAVDKAATEVCRYFDRNVQKVFAYLGWEQEYFLVDESLWAVRPDLMLTGRTLMGHESAKNQQLEDHYFGAIPTRVMAFMKDLEYECLKLGIPVKTRHNEVAPNQFELAPVYEEANLANDHNQLLMTIMDKIARRHQFRVLLHEKPFKGINGSGKHNNWSLGTDTGVNLFGTGKTASENLQFITFLVNAVSAVYKYNGLLKASIMSATNGHHFGLPRLAGLGRAGEAGRLEGRRRHPFRRQEHLPHERHFAYPDAAAGQYGPQPHVALRLHGQPVRVPRRRFVGQLRRGDDRAQYDDGPRADGVPPGRGCQDRGGREEGEGDLRGAQADDPRLPRHLFRRQRLFRGVEG